MGILVGSIRPHIDLSFATRKVLYRHLEPLRVPGLRDFNCLWVEPKPKKKNARPAVADVRYTAATQRLTSRFTMSLAVSSEDPRFRAYTIQYVHDIRDLTIELLRQIEARLRKEGHEADLGRVAKAIARDFDELAVRQGKAKVAAKAPAPAVRPAPRARAAKEATGKKQRPAAEVLKDRGDGEIWIDHAFITDDDFARLKGVRRLTLWNVDVPDGFLARLPKLWWIDLRGGSATDLRAVRGCPKLRYLSVNQVRGMRSLALVSTFTKLTLLNLYGLPQVKELPSLATLARLGRLELGMMAGLKSLEGALAAPVLKELYLSKKITVGARDVARITSHPTLRRFGWSTESVPLKIYGPVLDRIELPDAEAIDPEEWFGLA